MKLPVKNILKTNNLLNAGVALFILALTSIIYWPVAGFSFITGLDQVLLIDNTLLANMNTNTVTDLFFSSSGGRYMPLSMLSYAVDIHFAGTAPLRWIHLSNLMLHLANILLFYGLMKLLFRKSLVYIPVVLLFALHPLNVESVAWITSRPQLLSAFFILCSLLCYILAKETGARKKLLRSLAFFFFILALFSGPMAIVVPLILFFIERYRGKLKRSWYAGMAPWFLLSALFLFIAALIPDSPDIMDPVRGSRQTILSFLFATSVLTWKFFIPLGSAAYHPAPGTFDVSDILSISGVIILLLFPVLFWRRKPGLSGLMLLWITTLGISVLFSPYGSSNASESDAYLPGMFFFALAGWGIYQLYSILRGSPAFRKLLLVFPMAWIAWLIWHTPGVLPLWENSENAWTAVIRQYPDDHLAFYLRGDHWAMKGDFDRAKSDYSQCIHRNSQSYKAINNVGLIYLEEGAPRLALDEFMKAIDIAPDYYKAHLNRGLTYMRIGLNQKAMESIDRAVELEPNEPLGYYNRGLVYQRMNMLDKAIPEFSRAIQLEPYRLIFYKDRGKAYVWMKKFDLAERDYSKAIQLDPGNAEIWFRRSLARVSRDDFAGGLEDALMAKKLGFEVEEEYIRGLTVEVLKDELPKE